MKLTRPTKAASSHGATSNARFKTPRPFVVWDPPDKTSKESRPPRLFFVERARIAGGPLFFELQWKPYPGHFGLFPLLGAAATAKKETLRCLASGPMVFIHRCRAHSSAFDTRLCLRHPLPFHREKLWAKYEGKKCEIR